jgi:hypothetical protein
MSTNAPLDADPTLASIRSILHDEVPSKDVPEAKKGLKPVDIAALQAAVTNKLGSRKSQAQSSTPQKPKASEPRPNFANIRSPLAGMKLPFKVNRKYVFGGALILLALLRPMWVVLFLIFSLIVGAACFTIMGADRTWSKVMGPFKKFAARSPDRAHRMAARLDSFALRWDGFLDRFPEGTVDWLYLPDFRSLQDADERHDAVVDARLSRLRTEG